MAQKSFLKRYIDGKRASNTFGKLQNSVNKENFLEIKYEELVNNSKKELEKICEFLEIDYMDEMLDYWNVLINK